TTYRRVVLNGLQAPLEIWRAGDGRREELVPTGSIRVEEGGERVELTGVGAVQGDAADFPSDVVLWEVEWANTGDVFRPTDRAVREWRSEQLPLTLRNGGSRPSSGPVRVRAVDRAGRSGIAAIA
ncbi:MAG TPA: hypothetical protein VGA32_00885, partial [Anaerolineales bacterium]